jgi:hypothetical protein
MPHKPGHTNRNTTSYKVYGTNENYSGMTVEVGGFLYSTMGGALEGDSMQLVATAGSNPNMNTNQIPNPQNQPAIQSPGVQNPVTRTFVSRVTYYRQDGTSVPIGSNLHQHADGTIMLGHDPNNMGAIVTRQNPNAGNQTLGGAGLTTNPNQQQQDQLMGIGGQAGVNPNQDQQNQLMSGPGVNPNQDLQDTIAY